MVYIMYRFNAREFATLIIDILSEAKKRTTGSSVVASCVPINSNVDKGKTFALIIIYYLTLINSNLEVFKA